MGRGFDEQRKGRVCRLTSGLWARGPWRLMSSFLGGLEGRLCQVARLARRWDLHALQDGPKEYVGVVGVVGSGWY